MEGKKRKTPTEYPPGFSSKMEVGFGFGKVDEALNWNVCLAESTITLSGELNLKS